MNRIVQLRKEHKLSQKELAERLQVHQTAVSQWETGRTVPGFDFLCEMAALFDASVTYIMGTSVERGVWPGNHHTADRTSGQDRLLEAYNRLNPAGQAVAIERVEELAEISKYKRDAQDG